ncbi:glycosyltransferase [Serratia symbiotica]|uniref:glycosyltransferase n=1 Tax=Serratia symbiotica TaxID=138074 RepID=UPI0030CB1B98|nr:glycosyltransferase family 4 protein [Serratia symbiotica]
MSERTTFLMVSTVEPRKQHVQVLEAFELLWKNGKDINLVIVGKQGWMVEQLIKRLSSHKELNHRLFWLPTLSDEYLEQIYSAAACLIVAST